MFLPMKIIGRHEYRFVTLKPKGLKSLDEQRFFPFILFRVRMKEFGQQLETIVHR
jgi:hypothetical protein